MLPTKLLTSLSLASPSIDRYEIVVLCSCRRAHRACRGLVALNAEGLLDVRLHNEVADAIWIVAGSGAGVHVGSRIAVLAILVILVVNRPVDRDVFVVKPKAV